MEEKVLYKIEVDASSAVKGYEDAADAADNAGEHAESFSDKIKNAFAGLAGIGAEFKKGFSEGFKESFTEAQASTEKTTSLFQRMKSSIASIKTDVVGNFWRGFAEGWQAQEIEAAKAEENSRKASVVLKQMGEEAQNAEQKLSKLERVKAVFSGLWKGTKTLASGIGQLAKGAASVAKAFGARMAGKIKEVIAAAKDQYPIKQLTSSLLGLANTARRMLTRTIVRAIFSNFSDGIKGLAAECDGFNKAISGILGGIKQFSYQIVAAFAPLAEAVAPYIMQLTSLLSDLMGRVANFTATLTGADHYELAAPVAYDYAKEAADKDKSTDATKRATKAQKDYNASLLSFDVLHKLGGGSGSDGSGSESTSGATQAAEQTSAKFKKVTTDTETALGGFAKRLRDAFSAGAWVTLGKTLAEGLNSAFSWIDNLVNWENCGERIKKVIHGITQAFNSFIKEADFNLIGKTIADGLNTAINTIYELVTGIDWATLGTRIGEGINGLFGNIDWAKFAQTASECAVALLTTIANAIEAIDFAQMADALISFFQGIEWGRIVSAALEALGAAFAGLAVFLGELISGAIEGAIEYFKGSIEEAGGNIAQGLLNGIGKGLKNIGSWIKEHLIDPFSAGYDSVMNKAIDRKRGRSVLAYANGGTVSTGQMFLARERGPELVGSVGGTTAVMNNGQIVAAVSSGVAQAVSGVLGAQGGSGETYIMLDGEQVGTLINKAMGRRNTRINPVVAIG